MKPWIAVPATLALVYRAYSRNSLTPPGIVVAALTAVAHAIHPWSVFFVLLVVFFLAGTKVTKVKHDVKAKLTHSSSGSPGGEGPRNHTQVLANSLVASILILAHTFVLKKEKHAGLDSCWRRGAWPRTGDVLVSGIVANYAAVAADTFSSELGILSSSAPRLITAPWKKVAPGTNGGVTTVGILAGLLGSTIIAVTAMILTPFCSERSSVIQNVTSKGLIPADWSMQEKLYFTIAMAVLGLCGSLLDSLLGALLQASVIDVYTGKVIEGEGGQKVLVHATGVYKTGSRSETELRDRKRQTSNAHGHHESRRIETGWDVLSNNGVNSAMAGTISVIAVLGTAWAWDVPFSRLLG